jgi:hypothetical protein
MIRRNLRATLLGVVFLVVCGLLSPPLSAQAPAPETYSITELNSMFVQDMTVKTFRDGTKALVDRSRPPTAAKPKGYHHRTLYDFLTKHQYTWDVNDDSLPCGVQSFSGDWEADPFRTSARATADLASQNPKESGKETINGIRTKVLKITAPGEGAATIWVEEKYGLVVKFLKVPEGGTPQVLTEVKEFSLTRPPASLFELPPACTDAATMGHSETKSGKSHTVIEMVGGSGVRPSD